MENIHGGHRRRMKKKFLENGIEAFAEHEVLELLLYYAIPRTDTNETAHLLIQEFGSLSAVLDAPVQDLMKTGGLTENTATLLKLVPALLNVYSANKSSDVLDNVKAVTAYFQAAFLGVKDEEVKLCCLDDRLHVIACQTIFRGVPESVPISIRKIAETAFRYNCSLLILAHNHPNGESLPSKADISATRQILTALQPLGIQLLDHIVVGKHFPVSMKAAGYFNIFE